MPQVSLDHLRDVIGDLYTIDREFGCTALGDQIAAESSDGERVAICIIDRCHVDRMSNPEQFVRGLERARRLRHQVLVPLTGAGVTPDGILYYVTPLPAGETARAWLARSGAIPAAEVATLGAKIAGALAAAHTAGILHGSLTLESIRLTATGPRLNGLGLYDALTTSGIDRTAATVILTAPDGASPEQYTGTPATIQSDIYALGAALYELLIGKRPLGGRSTNTVMATVLADDQASHDAHTGHDAFISGPTIKAILRAIEHAPDDRWDCAARFATALTERIDSKRLHPLARMAGLLRFATTITRRS